MVVGGQESQGRFGEKEVPRRMQAIDRPSQGSGGHPIGPRGCDYQKQRKQAPGKLSHSLSPLVSADPDLYGLGIRWPGLFRKSSSRRAPIRWVTMEFGA